MTVVVSYFVFDVMFYSEIIMQDQAKSFLLDLQFLLQKKTKQNCLLESIDNSGNRDQQEDPNLVCSDDGSGKSSCFGYNALL